jgi:hypothetical protein
VNERAEMLSYVASVAASVALATFGVSDLVASGRESVFVAFIASGASVPGHLSHQNVQRVVFDAAAAHWQNEGAFDGVLNRGCPGSMLFAPGRPPRPPAHCNYARGLARHDCYDDRFRRLLEAYELGELDFEPESGRYARPIVVRQGRHE